MEFEIDLEILFLVIGFSDDDDDDDDGNNGNNGNTGVGFAQEVCTF